MKEGKVLIVYYSRSGSTRKLAEAIHQELGGETMELQTRQYPSGLRGYLRASVDAALGRAVPIKSKAPSSASYDLIVVGTPVWDSALSAPIRTFLAQTLPHGKRVAFFLTHGGSGARRVFKQMETVCGKKPMATLAVTVQELRRRNYGAKLEKFAKALQKGIEVAKAA